MRFSSIEHEEIYRKFVPNDNNSDQLQQSDDWVDTMSSLVEILEAESPYTIVAPNNLSKSSFNIKNLVKKIVSTLVGWYVNPFIGYQNNFNANVLILLKRQIEVTRQMADKIKKCEKEIEHLKKNNELFDGK